MLTNKEIIDNAPDCATHRAKNEVHDVYYKNITGVGYEYYSRARELWVSRRGKPIYNATKIHDKAAIQDELDKAISDARETPKKKCTLIEKRNATIQGQRAHIKSLQNKINELTKPKTESRWVIYDGNGNFMHSSKTCILAVSPSQQVIKIKVNV